MFLFGFSVNAGWIIQIIVNRVLPVKQFKCQSERFTGRFAANPASGTRKMKQTDKNLRLSRHG